MKIVFVILFIAYLPLTFSWFLHILFVLQVRDSQSIAIYIFNWDTQGLVSPYNCIQTDI